MRLMSLDVETRGTQPMYALQPFRALTGEAWLTSFAIARRRRGVLGAAGRLAPGVEDLRTVLQAAARTKTAIAAWNTAFDVAWLIALGLRDEVYAVTWLDGILLYKHLVQVPTAAGVLPFDLKTAVRTYFPDEAGYEENIDFEADTPEELARLREYNCQDAEFTLRLAEHFLTNMPTPMRRTAMIEAASIPFVAEAMVRGIRVDTQAAADLGQRLSDEAAVAFVKLRLRGAGVEKDVLASPKKLGKLLYDEWGLTAPHLTDTGAPSTDKDALTILGYEDPRASLVKEYREANNNKTKFCDGVVASEAYNGDGCVRPAPRIAGTYTGRMTYSSKTGRGKSEVPTGVALHQWKRDPAFRGLILPPPGYTLLEHDFAGQEYRWMAVESGDETMLELCAPGEDPHSYMGAKIAGMNYHALIKDVGGKAPGAKDKRQFGKVGNLSCQYRTSPPTLQRVARTQYQTNMSLDQARAIHGTYLSTYPRVKLYWRRQIKKARYYGYVENLAGRRIHLGEGHTWAEDKTWAMESTSINFPIQGIGADQKYLGLLALRDYLPKVGGHFYFELHDGLFSIVPDHAAEKAAVEIRGILSDLPYRKAWGVSLPVSFPVDAKMGPSWGELKEVA